MPGNPKECRQHAAKCRELASAAPNQEAREAFIDLAETWEGLAAELEGALAFLATLEELEKSERAVTAALPGEPPGE